MNDTEPKKKRPISAKQLAANRRNAQKSTGPRTRQGKNISRLNSLRHGLYATTEILLASDSNDSPRAFRQLYASLKAQLQPVGPQEIILIHKVTYYVWRYKLAIRALRELYQLQRNRGVEPSDIFLGEEVPVNTINNDETQNVPI